MKAVRIFIRRYYENLSSTQLSTLIVSIIYGLVLLVCSCIVSTSLLSWGHTISLSALAGIFGWVVGMAISPFNLEESKRFTGIGKTLSAFLSGYIFSKADKIIESVFYNIDRAIKGDSIIYIPGEDSTFRLISILSIFTLGIIVTYTFRYYDEVLVELANKAPNSGYVTSTTLKVSKPKP